MHGIRAERENKMFTSNPKAGDKAERRFLFPPGRIWEWSWFLFRPLKLHGFPLHGSLLEMVVGHAIKGSCSLAPASAPRAPPKR